jgi:hypothetical protein
MTHAQPRPSRFNRFYSFFRAHRADDVSVQVRERPGYSWRRSTTVPSSFAWARSWVVPAPAPPVSLRIRMRFASQANSFRRSGHHGYGYSETTEERARSDYDPPCFKIWSMTAAMGNAETHRLPGRCEPIPGLQVRRGGTVLERSEIWAVFRLGSIFAGRYHGTLVPSQESEGSLCRRSACSTAQEG